MIRNDTTHKVRIGVSEGHHQFGELLLVQLADSSKHSFPCSGTKGGVAHSGYSHSNDVGWKTIEKLVV